MEYKTPKVLEKKPVVLGFDLKSVIIIVGCILGSIFTLFVHPLVSVGLLGACVLYLRINKKYPKQGELTQFLKYNSSVKCIRINRQLKSLIRRKPPTLEEPTD